MVAYIIVQENLHGDQAPFEEYRKQVIATFEPYGRKFLARGGKVSVGSDSGYIYNLYGFGYVQEMELLREAGFSPLEVIHAATQVGAEVLGHEDEVGTIRVGRKADLAIVEGNPLANMKLLFGTGTIKLNDATGKTERVGGIHYTVKDGIVYDARALRAELRDMVAKAKAARGLPPGIMTIENAPAVQ